MIESPNGKPVIRPAERADMASLNTLYNHYVNETAITFDIAPWSLEQRLDWFDQFALEGRYRLLVAERGGVFVGYAGSLRFKMKEAYQTSVETTIYVDQGEQGQGTGLALYKALFEILEREAVHRAYGGITLPNAASVALHERAGFRHIGTWNEVGFKRGAWHDVAWYERRIGQS